MLTSHCQHAYGQADYASPMDVIGLRQRVQNARKTAGLTQAQVAASCGIKREAVAGWENGSSKSISSLNVFDAARCLKVSPEWLATGKVHYAEPIFHGDLQEPFLEAPAAHTAGHYLLAAAKRLASSERATDKMLYTLADFLDQVGLPR